MNTPTAHAPATITTLAGDLVLPTDLDLAQMRMRAERARAEHMRELYVGATEPVRRRFGPLAWRLRNSLRAAVAEYRTVRELRALDTHMLSDIGLEPADIRSTSRTIAKARFSGHWRPIRPLVSGMSRYAAPAAAANDLPVDAARAA